MLYFNASSFACLFLRRSDCLYMPLFLDTRPQRGLKDDLSRFGALLSRLRSFLVAVVPVFCVVLVGVLYWMSEARAEYLLMLISAFLVPVLYYYRHFSFLNNFDSSLVTFWRSLFTTVYMWFFDDIVGAVTEPLFTFDLSFLHEFLTSFLAAVTGAMVATLNASFANTIASVSIMISDISIEFVSIRISSVWFSNIGLCGLNKSLASFCSASC